MGRGLSFGLIVVVYPLEGIGDGLRDFVVVLGKQGGNGRGRGVGGFEQLERLDIQDGGEFHHARGGNPFFPVFNIAQEVYGNSQLFRKLGLCPFSVIPVPPDYVNLIFRSSLA